MSPRTSPPFRAWHMDFIYAIGGVSSWLNYWQGRDEELCTGQAGGAVPAPWEQR